EPDADLLSRHGVVLPSLSLLLVLRPPRSGVSRSATHRTQRTRRHQVVGLVCGSASPRGASPTPSVWLPRPFRALGNLDSVPDERARRQTASAVLAPTTSCGDHQGYPEPEQPRHHGRCGCELGSGHGELVTRILARILALVGRLAAVVRRLAVRRFSVLGHLAVRVPGTAVGGAVVGRKSTRLNSSHVPTS